MEREQTDSEPSWSSVEEEDIVKAFENGEPIVAENDESTNLSNEPNDEQTPKRTDTQFAKKCRRKRRDKSRKGQLTVDQEGALQLRPLLTPS